MDCECLSKCPFFNDKMASKPAMAELMKKQYCRNDYASCARYRIFKKMGREAVPADLFPSQTERADTILAGN